MSVKSRVIQSQWSDSLEHASSITGSEFQPKSSYIPNPTVIEQTARGERQYDIFSRMLLDRIVFLGTEINDTVANLIIAQFLFLDMQDGKKPIMLYINSPGGSVYAGLGIYDMMQHVSCGVETYCVGLAASMGAVLLAAGVPEKRYSLPNSRVMLHQPIGGATGQASDIEIQANEILRLKVKMNEIIMKHSSNKIKNIDDFIDRDKYLSAEEAKGFGLIDVIVPPKERQREDD